MSCGYVEVYFAAMTRRWRGGVARRRRGRARVSVAPATPPTASLRVTPRRVRSTEVKFPPELFRSTSSEGLSLVRGLLQRDVELRLTADQALEHPFFSLYATLVRSVSGLVEGIGPEYEEPPLL